MRAKYADFLFKNVTIETPPPYKTELSVYTVCATHRRISPPLCPVVMRTTRVPLRSPLPRPVVRSPLPCPVAVGRDVPIAPPRQRRGARLGIPHTLRVLHATACQRGLPARGTVRGRIAHPARWSAAGPPGSRPTAITPHGVRRNYPNTLPTAHHPRWLTAFVLLYIPLKSSLCPFVLKISAPPPYRHYTRKIRTRITHDRGTMRRNGRLPDLPARALPPLRTRRHAPSLWRGNAAPHRPPGLPARPRAAQLGNYAEKSHSNHATPYGASRSTSPCTSAPMHNRKTPPKESPDENRTICGALL